jgi:hypothetical protein
MWDPYDRLHFFSPCATTKLIITLQYIPSIQHSTLNTAPISLIRRPAYMDSYREFATFITNVRANKRTRIELDRIIVWSQEIPNWTMNKWLNMMYCKLESGDYHFNITLCTVAREIMPLWIKYYYSLAPDDQKMAKFHHVASAPFMQHFMH